MADILEEAEAIANLISPATDPAALQGHIHLLSPPPTPPHPFPLPNGAQAPLLVTSQTSLWSMYGR